MKINLTFLCAAWDQSTSAIYCGMEEFFPCSVLPFICKKLLFIFKISIYIQASLCSRGLFLSVPLDLKLFGFLL